MQKILLALNAVTPDKNALDFACYLARLTGSTLTGIFLENTAADEHPLIIREQGMSYVDWEVDKTSAPQLLKELTVEQTIAWFKEGCISRDVRCKVHRDRDVPAAEVVRESRFADFLVLDAETNFKNFYNGTPGEFAKEVLHKSECPVIIAPQDFHKMEELVFLYNGTASSVFAIKQFTYLLPHLYHLPVSVLQINETGDWEEIDKYHFAEWMKSHYNNVEFVAKKGKVASALFSHVAMKNNAFVVMGAYGRGALSQFLKNSTADQLIRIMNLPLFIAHL